MRPAAGLAQTGVGAPDFRPLYAQVKDLLIRRIASGEWRPGALLPSEGRLAAEYRVSQGTVRKALDDMAAQNMVERQQGRGTFVARHTRQRSLFHFFHVYDESGVKELPTSRVLRLKRERARSADCERLALGARARVLRILRLRTLGGEPAILERITLPEALFPDFDLPLQHELPDELYVIYQERFGVSIARAEEQIRAVRADAEAARHLGVAPGVPLLHIDRVARTLDGMPVEWRVSRCRSDRYYYLSELE